MKTLFNTDGNIKVTGNREQSVINVTLDFWNDEDERFMEIFCRVQIVGQPKVLEVLNPIMNPDSKNPTLLFPQRSDNFDLGTLKLFFSKRFVDTFERNAIRIAERTNAPENEMLNLTQ